MGKKVVFNSVNMQKLLPKCHVGAAGLPLTSPPGGKCGSGGGGSGSGGGVTKNCR